MLLSLPSLAVDAGPLVPIGPLALATWIHPQEGDGGGRGGAGGGVLLAPPPLGVSPSSFLMSICVRLYAGP